MTLELIVNVLLLIFSIVAMVNVSTTMPKSAVNELGAEQWPQLILVLLIAALCYNLYKVIKDNKAKGITGVSHFVDGVKSFLTSKLLIAMVIVVVMAWLYEPLGFMATCMLFMIAMGMLFGERRPHVLIIAAIVVTILLYVVFSAMLGLMLPRGYIGFLRSIALFIEGIFS